MQWSKSKDCGSMFSSASARQKTSSISLTIIKILQLIKLFDDYSLGCSALSCTLYSLYVICWCAAVWAAEVERWNIFEPSNFHWKSRLRASWPQKTRLSGFCCIPICLLLNLICDIVPEHLFNLLCFNSNSVKSVQNSDKFCFIYYEPMVLML